MADEKKQIVSWFTHLQQGQIYAYSGILLCIAALVNDNYQFIDQGDDYIAYMTGAALFGIGTVMSIWRKIVEGKDS
jgi:hypothetical protein